MAVFRDLNQIEHDRSVEDRRRHRELVEKSIKDNLGDILSEESIIGESKNKKYKIPIRGLKEYQFIYGKNVPGIASGDGSEKKGDKLGSDKAQNAGKGANGAGNQEGDDIYETEITLEDILNYLIEDLELPDLYKKKYASVLSENSTKKSGYQKYGINPRLAKKRTVIEKIKREQCRKRALKEIHLTNKIDRFPFNEDDLRYYRIKKTQKKDFNAVIICIMDISGSMDNSKKYLARSFFFVLSRFIKMKYSNVEIVFISHTTTAKVVNEDDFFHRAESGGTYISSGYNKALEVIEERFNPSCWNIYTFYVSDGDNWSEDNENAVEAAKALCNVCNMLGYAEIMPAYYSASIKNRLVKEITRKNFSAITIEKSQDLWPALKEMLKKS